MNDSTRRSRGGTGRAGRASLLVVAACLVLPACHIPHLRSPDVPPDLPPTFETTANSGRVPQAPDSPPPNLDNSSRLGVQQFFNDPLLTDLIEQALANNRELKILNEEVEIARNEILARRGAYLPFLSLGASTGVDKPSIFTPLGAAEDQLQFRPGQNFPDPLPNFIGSLNIGWQVDIWRELRNARDASIQRFVSAQEKRNYFVTEMVAEIADTYYGLMALDKRLETLDQTIKLQENSRAIAQARKDAGRGTELAVLRFEAEVRKNQSEKLIVNQDIIEAENRINFLVNRFPQPVQRNSAVFYDLTVQGLSAGVPAQLLQNRPDIRQAERELAAAGLDIQVARAHFFPRVDLVAGVGYQAFSPQYLFLTPDALIYGAAANVAAPLVNRAAIKAEYLTANAKQLVSVYNYQRVVLDAFTEVVNRMSMVENYGKSIEFKKQQLGALEGSVEAATKLFQNARVEYVEVLLAQRDMLEAKTVLIETKRRELSAIVNAYQALGGGDLLSQPPPGAGVLPLAAQPPELHQLPPPREVNEMPGVQQLPAPRKANDAP